MTDRTRANRGIVLKNLTEIRAGKVRLEAERDGADALTAPDELGPQIDDPAFSRVRGV